MLHAASVLEASSCCSPLFCEDVDVWSKESGRVPGDVSVHVCTNIGCGVEELKAADAPSCLGSEDFSPCWFGCCSNAAAVHGTSGDFHPPSKPIEYRCEAQMNQCTVFGYTLRCCGVPARLRLCSVTVSLSCCPGAHVIAIGDLGWSPLKALHASLLLRATDTCKHNIMICGKASKNKTSIRLVTQAVLYLVTAV